MVIYVDSSALLKRVIAERESDALENRIARHVEAADLVVSSVLARVEIERAIRRSFAADLTRDPGLLSGDALAGVAEAPLSAEVLSVARRIGPPGLRSLDALHLATAILLDVDMVLAYDARLLESARANGLEAEAVTA
jgi:predicted nucleic acid-binding protein